jgi:WD40 repeat protein
LTEVQIPEYIDEGSNINLFHLLMVHPRGVEMFCLFSGMPRIFKYVPEQNRRILVATSCRASPDGDYLIIGEDNGVFKTLNMANLSVQASIEPQSDQQRNRVTCIISPAPDLIYAGYQDGSIKVWHTASQEPQFEFNSDQLLPGVRSLAFAHKSRLLISGHESSFEDSQGRAVKLESNPIRVYAPHAGDYETKTLSEFKGTCFGLVVLEEYDLVVALSSEENRLYLWDF